MIHESVAVDSSLCGKVQRVLLPTPARSATKSEPILHLPFFDQKIQAVAAIWAMLPLLRLNGIKHKAALS